MFNPLFNIPNKSLFSLVKNLKFSIDFPRLEPDIKVFRGEIPRTVEKTMEDFSIVV